MADNLLERRVEEFLQECPTASREEIQEFRVLVEQYFTGAIDPATFKSRRLHLGTYGIRGVHDVQMMRIKITGGLLTAEQLEALAEVAEEYAKGIGHITTRQAIQLYWIPIKAAPTVMARLAAVGLTTREACGNSVRGVTACPLAGVSPTEAFDVTKHTDAAFRYFLRHPASQKLPRKFKVAFEGCPEDHARTSVHDVGLVAELRDVDGKPTPGFRIYAAGGLGAMPAQGILIEEWTPAIDMLRTIEAVIIIHDKHGDRKNRAMARVKVVAKKVGAEKFIEMVLEERAKLAQRPYDAMYETETDEQPPVPQEVSEVTAVNGVYTRWSQTNVTPQKQEGYSTVTIRLRLGDVTSAQMRSLAQIVRKYCGGKLRTAITQNLYLRWIHHEHLPSLYSELHAVGLAATDAERLLDVTSCPGAETCQLGISASRGLARAVESHLREAGITDTDIDDLRIKVSGCPNSCGQHHIADMGFFGAARKVNGHLAPHFQLMLGGRTREGFAAFGTPVMKLPARRIPEAIVKILTLYRSERTSADEEFHQCAERLGAPHWKAALAEFETLPAFEDSPESYRDWGAENDFSLEGMGPGECAA